MPSKRTGLAHQGQGYHPGHMIFGVLDPIAKGIYDNNARTDWFTERYQWLVTGYEKKIICPEAAMRAWALIAMMLDRDITMADMAAVMTSTRKDTMGQVGLSRERVRDLFNNATYANDDAKFDRLEDAMTKVTDARGGVYAAAGEAQAGAMQKGLENWKGTQDGSGESNQG